MLCVRGIGCRIQLTHLLHGQGQEVKGRVLIIADGATSKLATHMGYCHEPPKGVCSRAYVEGGTHNTSFDGETLGLDSSSNSHGA